MERCGLDLAEYRAKWKNLVNTVKDLRVPSNVRKLLTSSGPIIISRNLLHGLIFISSNHFTKYQFYFL
jgi:hypothetical protein